MPGFKDSDAYRLGVASGQRYGLFAISHEGDSLDAHLLDMETFEELRDRHDDAEWREWTGQPFHPDIVWNAAVSVPYEFSADIRAAMEKEDTDTAFVLAMMRWRRWLEAELVDDEDHEVTVKEAKRLADPSFIKGFVDGVVAIYRQWPSHD